MKSKCGKLFKNLSDNTINCFEYNSDQEYYPFIQKVKKQGFNQCIITSDIMIFIIEHFILEYNAEIIGIKFMIEDSDLDYKISSMLKSMRKNAAYWGGIKQELLFLSENDSIEMKEVHLRIDGNLNTLFTIKVNGVIIVGESEFDAISNKILGIVGGCLG